MECADTPGAARTSIDESADHAARPMPIFGKGLSGSDLTCEGRRFRRAKEEAKQQATGEGEVRALHVLRITRGRRCDGVSLVSRS